MGFVQQPLVLSTVSMWAVHWFSRQNDGGLLENLCLTKSSVHCGPFISLQIVRDDTTNGVDVNGKWTNNPSWWKSTFQFQMIQIRDYGLENGQKHDFDLLFAMGTRSPTELSFNWVSAETS